MASTGAAVKIQPLGDRVVVKALESLSKTKGGIVLPDTAKEKPQEGEIIAVGKGRLLESGEVKPLEVKVGDKVLYGKYSGTETTVDNEEYVVLLESDILGIVD